MSSDTAQQERPPRQGQQPPARQPAQARKPEPTPGNWRIFHKEEGADIVLSPLADPAKMAMVTARYPLGIVAETPLRTADEAKMAWLKVKQPDLVEDIDEAEVKEWFKVNARYNMRAVRMKDEEPRPLGVAPPLPQAKE